MIYLTSLKSLLDVIMKFVTLASICKFDDMYAASLFENKIKAAAGKKLKKYYYRRHAQVEEELILNKKDDDYKASTSLNPAFVDYSTEIHQTGNIDFQMPIATVDGEKIYGNARRGDPILWCLRFIFKSVRLMYVSTIYYFMPFLFIFITFMSNMPMINPAFS